MLQDRFVVEVGKRVVGLAIRTAGGFRFFATDPSFADMEAELFPRARTLIDKAESHHGQRRQPRLYGPFTSER